MRKRMSFLPLVFAAAPVVTSGCSSAETDSSMSLQDPSSFSSASSSTVTAAEETALDKVVLQSYYSTINQLQE